MHGTKRGMQIVDGGIRSRRARLLFYVCMYSHWYDYVDDHTANCVFIEYVVVYCGMKCVYFCVFRNAAFVFLPAVL